MIVIMSCLDNLLGAAVSWASLTQALGCEGEHARIVTCRVERPCRAIAVDGDVVPVVG